MEMTPGQPSRPLAAGAAARIRGGSGERKKAAMGSGILDALEFIDVDTSFLTAEQQRFRSRIRRILDGPTLPPLHALYETATLDRRMADVCRQMGPAGLQMASHGGPGLSNVEAMIVAMELCRVDGSLATFYMVHSGLAIRSIEVAGSEDQKQRFLPAMVRYDKIGAFGLTEPNYGSDASSLQTSARRVEGGWLLNGEKRWIGNATFADIIVIWARDEASKQVFGFLVEKGSKGLRTTKIENKMSLRIVQNANIYLTDCFVPESNRMPKGGFGGATSRVLETSRALVAGASAGLLIGAYERALKYCRERLQFGQPLVRFQLVQERLMRALGNALCCASTAFHIAKLMDSPPPSSSARGGGVDTGGGVGAATMAQIALAKATCTRLGREGVSLCREVVGGNGIVYDFGVAAPFADMEALYTYEGTYDVNTLLAGRSVTGISAML